MSEYAVLTAKYQLFYNHFCTNGFLQSCDFPALRQHLNLTTYKFYLGNRKQKILACV